MDCEKLSPNAKKIFDKIKDYFPPDPWQNPRWTEDGKVNDNGWHDLKKSEDRDRLINRYRNYIGSSIVLSIRADLDHRGGSIDYDKIQKVVEGCYISLNTRSRFICLVVLLEELDFQIETMDLVES